MWIELGEIDYKIIIPLIYPFLYEIRRLIHKDDERFLFELFTNFCGYLFSGIIYLIIKFRMKNRIKSSQIEKKDDLQSEESDNIDKVIKINNIKNPIDLENKKTEKKRIRNQYLFLLLLVIIGLFPMFLDTFINSDNKLNFGTSSSVSLFFYIIFFIVFSRIILGEKIYSHQIFSSIIIIISTIIIIILFFINTELSENIFVNIIIILIITFLYTLYDVIEKKYYNIYMGSPYHLMFVIGIFSLVLILLYEIITVIIFGIDWNYNGIFYQFGKNYEKYNGLYILIFIGDILSSFIWIAGIELTIYFFTPCHFIISESISQIISTFVNDIIENFIIYEKIIIYTLFIIIILATLLYTEVFIIKICSLNKNTKKYITLREKNEFANLLATKRNESDNWIDVENDERIISIQNDMTIL